MISEIRQGFRFLTRNAAFTAIAVSSLALGIGGNTAIFTIASRLLFRPLSYSEPHRLVLVSAPPAHEAEDAGWLSYPFFTLLNERNRSFSSLAACTFETFSLSGHGDPEQVFAARTSWNFFDVLGVRPVVGRTFTQDEDQRGGPLVVLISHELWTRLFGRDPSVVGRALRLESHDYTIVGVLPAGFAFSLIGPKIDVWAPRVFEMSLVTPARVAAGGRYFQVIGRLASGGSKDQARAETAGLLQQYKRDKPGNYDATSDLVMQVDDLQARMVANLRPALFFLWAAVAFVLLIACANVASLFLSLALGRRKEFAVRAALGGSRGALIRQLLTESILLGLISGTFGVVVGAAGMAFVAEHAQDMLPGTSDLAMDAQAVIFTLSVSVLAGILFGLAPALQFSTPDLNVSLREEGRGAIGSRRRNHARSLLVIAQVALSCVLFIGSGLLIRSFINLRSVSPGFDPNNVLTLQVSLRKYNSEQSITFYNSVLRRVNALPGVASAAVSTALPPTATHETPVLFEGHPRVPIGKRPIINLQQISPGYSVALGIPIIAGRGFSIHDDARSPRVAMINQVAARRFWPNQGAIGKHVWVGNGSPPIEVVGVLGDTRNSSLAAPPSPEIFLPFPQLPWSFFCLIVRSNVEPHSLTSTVRREIAAVDSDQPVIEIHTGEELLDASRSQMRFLTFLLGAFSAFALMLAVMGIYGLMAYTVEQRREELEIRIALGAAKEDILWLVVSNGLFLSGVGILIGLAGSLALTRLMAAMLFETSATDPLTFLATGLLFIAVAALASYLPARRATAMDPYGTLRTE
jgi:predicted permease